MATTRYTVISGSDGNDINGTNTPGVDTIVRTGSNSGAGTILVETTNALLGGRSMRFTKDATNAPTYVRFDEAEAASIAVRFSFRLLEAPSATVSIFNPRNLSGSSAFSLAITNPLLPRINNAAGGAVWSGASALSLNVDYRFEAYATNGDTNGTIKARVIRESDDVEVANTSTTFTNVDMSTGNFELLRLGAGITSTTTTSDFLIHYLDLEMGASDYLPVYSSQTSPNAAATMDGSFQFINASSSAPAGSDTSVTVVSIAPSTGTVISPDSNGDIGVFVPNTTQAYVLTVAGQPSGLTSTVNVNVTQIVGTEVNVSAPRRPDATTDPAPGNAWF